MRRIARPAVALPTLKAIDRRYGDGWKESAAGGPADGQWNEPDVRGALVAMHGWACAYCELELRGGDRGDVEHFRPKSTYRWLAYDFENYLLSCLACNREMKGNRFPLAPGAKPVTYRDRARLDRELRLLLDPVADPTEDLIEYDVFNPDTLCAALPKQGLSQRHADMARETIRFYEFNTGRDLSEKRRDVVKAVEQHVTALELGDPDRRLVLATMACRFKPHSSVVRRLLAPGYADLIPTPEEEMFLLLEELAGRLLRCQGKLLQEADERAIGRERRQEQELLHALAVLWLANPVLDSAAVEDALTALGVKGAVEPCRDTLRDC